MEQPVRREPPLVVVVAYGSPGLLARCLSTLRRTHDVLVVDNSRMDEVQDLGREHGAHYVRPERNLGFAAGVNLALASDHSERDFLLLNPDAAISPGEVALLHAALHAPGTRRAAVAPRLRRPDGSTERTAWPTPTPLTTWAGAIGLADRAGRREEFLSGAVLMINREAWREIGGFDERFFLYAEEADWQHRAVRAGWQVAVVDAASALHVGAATSSDPSTRVRLFHGAAELYVRKWYGLVGWQTFRAGSIAAALRRAVLTSDPGLRATQWQVVRLYAQGPARQLPDFARQALGC